MEDSCPHRMAPLSLGFISEDKQLVCRYHGWEFGNDGKATAIPMSTDAKAEKTACESPRSCAVSYPVKEEAGVLWVWPTAGADAWLEASATPVATAAAAMANRASEPPISVDARATKERRGRKAAHEFLMSAALHRPPVGGNEPLIRGGQRVELGKFDEACPRVLIEAVGAFGEDGLAGAKQHRVAEAPAEPAQRSRRRPSWWLHLSLVRAPISAVVHLPAECDRHGNQRRVLTWQ